MTLIRTSILGAAALALFASTAFGQSDIAPRNAVSFVAGAGSATSTNGVVLGGSWLFDMNDYASLEGQGMYLDRGAGANALNVSGSVLIHLVSVRERVVPFAAVGGGLYRTSFDLANAALLGSNGMGFGAGAVVCPAPGTGAAVGPGPWFGSGPGTGTCPASAAGSWGVGQMPAFYGRRLGPMTVPMGGFWQSRAFTDPALTLGGGLRFNVNEHVLVRPDVRALFVMAEGATHTLGVFTVQLGYRF